MALACTHAASFRSTNTVAIRLASSSSGQVVTTAIYFGKSVGMHRTHDVRVFHSGEHSWCHERFTRMVDIGDLGDDSLQGAAAALDRMVHTTKPSLATAEPLRYRTPKLAHIKKGNPCAP